MAFLPGLAARMQVSVNMVLPSNLYPLYPQGVYTPKYPRLSRFPWDGSG